MGKACNKTTLPTTRRSERAYGLFGGVVVSLGCLVAATHAANTQSALLFMWNSLIQRPKTWEGASSRLPSPSTTIGLPQFDAGLVLQNCVGENPQKNIA